MTLEAMATCTMPAAYAPRASAGRASSQLQQPLTEQTSCPSESTNRAEPESAIMVADFMRRKSCDRTPFALDAALGLYDDERALRKAIAPPRECLIQPHSPAQLKRVAKSPPIVAHWRANVGSPEEARIDHSHPPGNIPKWRAEPSLGVVDARRRTAPFG